ncbi:MAG: hypothetical protein HYX32_12455 [Actinobacteria bacterium]|nr:hypothetical protein [Actinomycetota bacterium]
MALAELVRDGGARDIHTTTPARPEITLVFHAGQPLPQDDTDNPTNPDRDQPDRGEPDGDAPEASEPVDDTAEQPMAPPRPRRSTDAGPMSS